MNSLQNQGANSYLDQAQLGKLRMQLTRELNAERAKMNLKKLLRCRRGDAAAQELAECGIGQGDYAFSQM